MILIILSIFIHTSVLFGYEMDFVDEVFGEDEVNFDHLNHEESDWTFDSENFDIDPPEKLFMNRSIIDWKKVNHQSFLSFQFWLRERLNRDRFPNWKEIFQNTKYNELVGVALGCYGECNLYRGERSISASFRSRLREGDEVQTGDDSYFLMLTANGTLVRVSPNSSLVFSEINFTKENHFVYFKLNYGHVYWEPRVHGKYEFISLSETETIFYPYEIKEANLSYVMVKEHQKLKEKDPFQAEFYQYIGYEKHIQTINDQRLENNEFSAKRDDIIYVVAPNSSVLSINSIGHFFYSLAQQSNIRIEKSLNNFQRDDKREQRNLLYLRGYNNDIEAKLELGQTYVVDKKGRNFETKNENPFQILQTLLSRNYSTQLLREILIREKWSFLFEEDYSGAKLSQMFGYRLWNQLYPTEMYYRFEFLKEYTRRVETTFLKQLASFNFKSDREFGVKHYGKSLDLYLKSIKKRNGFKRQVIKYFDDLDYYIWSLKQRGQKFYDFYTP
ncbi:hypothetical protein N9N67_03780 [Bacteriovoracaceae bacterium]|nr:hypothetical protein [Bacteriovoracaceae bacterium]